MHAYDELNVAVFKKACIEAMIQLRSNKDISAELEPLMINLLLAGESLSKSMKTVEKISELAQSYIGDSNNDQLKRELLTMMYSLLQTSENTDLKKLLDDTEAAIAHHKMEANGKIDTELAADVKWSPATMHLAVAAKRQSLGERAPDQELLCMNAGLTPFAADNELSVFLGQSRSNTDMVKGKTFHIAVRAFSSLGGANEYGDPEETSGHWVYFGVSFDAKGTPISMLNDYFAAKLDGSLKELRDLVINTFHQHYPDAPLFLYCNDFNVQYDATNCARFTLNMMTAMRTGNVFSELRAIDASSANSDKTVVINCETIPKTTAKFLRGMQNVSDIQRLKIEIKSLPIQSKKGETTLGEVFESSKETQPVKGKPTLVNAYIQFRREKYAARAIEYKKGLSPEGLVDLQAQNRGEAIFSKKAENANMPIQAWVKKTEPTAAQEETQQSDITPRNPHH